MKIIAHRSVKFQLGVQKLWTGVGIHRRRHHHQYFDSLVTDFVSTQLAVLVQYIFFDYYHITPGL